MLQTGYIVVDNRNKARPTEAFLRCKKYNDWTPLVTPQIAKKISA